MRPRYRIPDEIHKKLEELAELNGRSVNSEVINILRDYLEMPVKWEKWIIKAIQEIALEKGYTVSWAVNFLVGMKLSDLDEAGQKAENPKKAAGQ